MYFTIYRLNMSSDAFIAPKIDAQITDVFDEQW